MELRRVFWIPFISLAIIVGLYPSLYFLVDMSGEFFATKSAELQTSHLWNSSFYTHIAFGGIALLLGWTQFSKKFRATKMGLHRVFGKIYILSILFSGTTGLYVSLHASGGLATKLGFSSKFLGCRI